MKSIKPGRGPSMMGGIMSVAMGIFGLIWTIAAASMGGGLFALFGLVFIGVAIVQAIYNFRNATAKDRFSIVDITGSHEESDPLQDRFGRPAADAGDSRREDDRDGEAAGEGFAFCPYCGARLAAADFEFCPHCGRELPQ